MKRGRSGGSVTGGTGDVKPQQLTLTTGTAGAVDDYVTALLPLPVPRFGSQGKDQATIFEILWVDWYVGLEDATDVASSIWAFLNTATTRSDGETSTTATLLADVLDPRSFAVFIRNKFLTTSGQGIQDYPFHMDMTDNNGNGYLVATDRLAITCGAAANTAAISAMAKVAYRLVNVGLTEYIGIVQSQQGNA